MTASYVEARNAIFKLIKNAWSPTGYKMIWPDKPDVIPTDRVPWARTTLQHITGAQSTLARFDGKSRFKREGIIAVQIFTPSGEGLSRSYELGNIITNAFEGVSTLNDVWFRNTRINEIGPESNWYQLNVLSDFIYDELK